MCSSKTARGKYHALRMYYNWFLIFGLDYEFFEKTRGILELIARIGVEFVGFDDEKYDDKLEE